MQRSRSTRLIVLLLAGSVTVAACSTASEPPTQRPSSEPSVPTSALEAAVEPTTTTTTVSTTEAQSETPVEVLSGGDPVAVVVEPVPPSVGPAQAPEVSGQVWDITGPSGVDGPFTLKIPAGTGDPSSELLASWSEELGMWIPVETALEGPMLVAEVEHFSWWAPVASWVEYRVGRLTGTRSGKPQCDGSPPEWASPVNTVEDDNAELFACGETDVQGRLVLRIVNNRDYGVFVDFNHPWTGTPTTSIPTEIWTLFLQLTEPTFSNQRLYITGGTEATAVFERPSQTVNLEAHAQRDVGALLAYSVFELVEAVGGDIPVPGGGTLGVAAVQCYVDTATSTWTTADGVADLSLDAIIEGVGGFTGCIEQLLVDTIAELDDNSPWIAPLSKAQRLVVAWKAAKYSTVIADLAINDRAGTEADLVDINALLKHDKTTIEFPVWEIPEQSGEYAAVYLAYAGFRSEGWQEAMQKPHDRLAEIGLDLWGGHGSLGCDMGAIEALGLEDGLTVGVYFTSPDDAHRFADAWTAYFGEPPLGVVDNVKTFCLDE